MNSSTKRFRNLRFSGLEDTELWEIRRRFIHSHLTSLLSMCYLLNKLITKLTPSYQVEKFSLMLQTSLNFASPGKLPGSAQLDQYPIEIYHIPWDCLSQHLLWNSIWSGHLVFWLFCCPTSHVKVGGYQVLLTVYFQSPVQCLANSFICSCIHSHYGLHMKCPPIDSCVVP
jgi:hypothetical protein